MNTKAFKEHIAEWYQVLIATAFIGAMGWGVFLLWAESNFMSAEAGEALEERVESLEAGQQAITRGLRVLQDTTDINEQNRRLDALKNTRAQLRTAEFQLRRIVEGGDARESDRKTLNSINNQLIDIESEIDLLEVR